MKNTVGKKRAGQEDLDSGYPFAGPLQLRAFRLAAPPSKLGSRCHPPVEFAVMIGDEPFGTTSSQDFVPKDVFNRYCW